MRSADWQSNPTANDGALPSAPMAMPEQSLLRERRRGFTLRPLVQWLAFR